MSGHPKEFGKRRPQPPAPKPPPTPPVKRSSQVALLLMGTLAVGGTAYALMPHGQSCPQQAADATVAGQPQPAGGCTTSRSGSSGGGGSGGSGRWGFSSSSDSSGGSSHVADASSGHVARGGFGGSAHGFWFSGGG